MIIRTPDNMTGAEARALLVALEGTAEERAQHSALWANCSDVEAREAVQDNLRDFGPWRLDGVLYTARAEVVAGRGEVMTGRMLYERDVNKNPNYHDGTPRRGWEQLEQYVKNWWDKMATREICEARRKEA